MLAEKCSQWLQAIAAAAVYQTLLSRQCWEKSKESVNFLFAQVSPANSDSANHGESKNNKSLPADGRGLKV